MINRLFLSLILINCFIVSSFGQQVAIKGSVFEEETKEAVEQATIQLLSLPDSVFVTGIASGQGGRFTLPKVKPGKYLLRASFIGLHPKEINVNLTSKDKEKDVGAIYLRPDAVLLEEAVIVAEAPQVTVAGDTLVYNSSAYRLPEGSMLEELVKKLPGAEIDEEGKITINGQEVKKIMVDGKEFFVNDPDIAMKNLPVNMVEKISAYNKKSDMARITGIDDGEEEAVLDISVKKGMNQGWFGNIDGGYGNHDRYLAKGMLNRFKEGDQYTGLFNINNVNDRGFGGGARWGRGFGGMEEKQDYGFNFGVVREKYEIGGNVWYNDSERDNQNQSTSETFLQDRSSFSKGSNMSLNKNKNFNASLMLEWKPDTLTNILFRPSFSYGKGNSRSEGFSYTGDVDDFDDWEGMIQREEAINTNQSLSVGKNKSISANGSIIANRKLNDKGRNLTFRVDYGYGNNDSDQSYYSLIEYFKKQDQNNERDQLIRNDNTNYNYRLQVTYSEPIFTNRFLQFSYSYQHRYQESDRRTYDVLGIEPGDDLDPLLDKDLSKYAENKYDNHSAGVSLRTIREKYQYNIGVEVQPQRNRMAYEQGVHLVDTSRSVVNFTPTFDFRYRFHKQSELRINYRGWSSQPNMTDLLPIRDETNPLNIREGNPGLKPSFSNNFSLFYNTYLVEKQMGIMARLFFSNTLNSVSSKVIYDPETGGRTTTPVNINGNWNINGFFTFNTPLKNRKFNISTHTNARYSNMVGFTSTGADKDAEKNTTKNLGLNERVRGSYRNDKFEFGLNAGIRYSISRNSLTKQSNRETFNYTFGSNTEIMFPWDITLSMDASYEIKKGYSEGMNENEFIWNAQLTKDLFKQKQGSLSFQIFDILKQQSNIRRSLTASMRQDTETNAINSYFMVHFIYRLNTFGKGGGGEMRGQGSRSGRRGGPGLRHY
ncbi:MAG: outer membrane beta-barrel protein [Bacteroidales bacterium]|nr:outer membrane beta-barrel protein [Bacteroidales bacterium]